jgi:hypothetical protein
MRIGDPTDPKNLAENLAALSDDDLIDMINIHFQQYRPDALIIARRVGEARLSYLEEGQGDESE